MSWVRERRKSAAFYTSRHSPRAWLLAGVLIGVWLLGASDILARLVAGWLR